MFDYRNEYTEQIITKEQITRNSMIVIDTSIKEFLNQDNILIYQMMVND